MKGDQTPQSAAVDAVSIYQGPEHPPLVYVAGEDGVQEIFRISWPSGRNDAMVVVRLDGKREITLPIALNPHMEIKYK